MQVLNGVTHFNTSSFNSLPVILIKIGNKKYKALLDSGASISLMSQGAYQQISSKNTEVIPSDPLIKISSISGEEIKIRSTIILAFSIENTPLRHKVLVTHTNFSKDYDFIFGFDFLKNFDCNINFKHQTLYFNEGKTTILKYEKGKINNLTVNHVGKLNRKIKLPAQSSSIVHLKVSNSIAPGTNVLVQPLDNNYNIEMHRSVCTVSKNKTIALVINNLSKNKLHLNKHSKIANIEPNIDIKLNDNLRRLRREELKEEHFDWSGVPSNAKQKLKKLIFEFADIFSTNLKTIGKCTLEAPPIEITDTTPIQCRPFPVPIALRENVRKQISELEDAGIIEKSRSRYSFPLILVRKKMAGEYRLVVDYRKLNEITVSSTYKLPLISDILNSLRGSNYFSTLDANSSFHQIKLRDEDKALTAFTSPYGNFQYKFLSFGLKNSPQIFQEIADTLLNGLQSENISAYIDDIIVPSQNIDEALRKLRLVFERFREYGLTLNPKKCKFLQTKITYLGHDVNKDGIKPLPHNLSSIKNFPVPNTVRKLRRFLGCANYYRDFVPNFSEIVSPLTDLTKSKNKFKWSQEAQNAFNLIKSKLLSDVMLKHPNFEELFYLQTDASKIAVGAALLQKDSNGILRPISYFSHKLKPHEQKWPAIQLEAYAILSAVRHYKVYLYGRKFEILSDCKSLNYLLKLDSPASRLSRWLLELSNYDFKFTHIKGSQNFLGDLLSRDITESINVVKADVPDIETIKKSQRNDPNLNKIISSLEGNNPNLNINTENYFLENGLLKRISRHNKRSARNECLEQIVIPKDLIPYILEGSETVHFAFFKNYRAIREKYYWPNMYIDIKNFSNSCKLCIEKKGFHLTKSPMKNFDTPSYPMELISLDILGPLPLSERGSKYILTVIDHFTKFSTLFALENITAETVANKLISVILTHGVPNAILTDLGTNFQSQLFNNLAKMLQINKLKTTPYHPQTNSAAERLNASIKNSLTCLADTVSNWDTYLGYYNFIYNNSYHDTLLEKPSFLMFNRDLNLPFHILEQKQRNHYFPCENFIEENMRKMQFVYRQVYQNLETAADKQKRNRDKIAHPKTFYLGQKVYLYTPSSTQSTGRVFAKKFSGPYRIIEKHSDLNYTIQDINKPFKKPTKIHADRIFSYTQRRPDLQLPELTTTCVREMATPAQNQAPKGNVPNYQNTSSYYDAEDDCDDYIPCPIRQPDNGNNSQSQNNADNTETLLQQPSAPQNQQTHSVDEKVSNPSTPGRSIDQQPPTIDSSTPRYNLRNRPGRTIASTQVANSDAKPSSKNSSNTNTSLSNRILTWAMNSDNSNQDKGILEKVADALSAKLSDDLETDKEPNINNITFYPQQTHIFYNHSYCNR